VAALSLTIPAFGTFYEPGQLHRVVELARAVEDAGVTTVVVPDHVVIGPHTDRYPWGTFPYGPDAPWLEPLAVLAAIAGATSRLRLSTGILIAPLRPATLLAKTAATIDVLSGGRLDLGVGTGWQREELEATGVDHDRRGQILTDTIAACRALWGPSPASFQSSTVSFRDIWCEPKPVQPGGVPILFSGTLTPRNIDRISTLGDGWIPIMGSTADDVASGVSLLRDALREAGRDPSTLRVRSQLSVVRDAGGRPDLAATLEAVPERAQSGVTDVQLTLQSFARSPEGVPAFLADLSQRWSGAPS
jgi:probable F420-dependent oxidoreductase